MRDEVQVEGIVEVRRHERFEDFVRLLARGFFRNPAQALGHAKYMRVYREPGQYGLNV